MSRFTLTFNTNNAAFRDEEGGLVVEAIRDLLASTSDRMDGFTPFLGMHEFLIRDINGNQIGSAIVEED